MVTTVILQKYDLRQSDFDSVEWETDFSEKELKEIAYAFLDGKHPWETAVISSILENSSDRSRAQYLDDNDGNYYGIHEPDDPEREEYYENYNADDEAIDDYPFYPSSVPKSYVSDNWYEVFPELDEMLENTLWTARKTMICKCFSDLELRMQKAI